MSSSSTPTAEAIRGRWRRYRDCWIAGKRQFPYVIVEAHRQTTVEALIEIVRRSWSVYPILRQNGESLFELNLSRVKRVLGVADRSRSSRWFSWTRPRMLTA